MSNVMEGFIADVPTGHHYTIARIREGYRPDAPWSEWWNVGYSQRSSDDPPNPCYHDLDDAKAYAQFLWDLRREKP